MICMKKSVKRITGLYNEQSASSSFAASHYKVGLFGALRLAQSPYFSVAIFTKVMLTLALHTLTLVC